MALYEKNGNILYILNILKKYSDEEHILSAIQIGEKIKEIYNVDVESRTIRRNIELLKEKFEYEISTRSENGKGYYFIRNPQIDFEPGELRAIIDTFSYANYIVPSISKNIIEKCKNIQNVYENEKLKDYKIYALNKKTENMEVIKNIEDISLAIKKQKKIQFEYWKYSIEKKLEKKIVSNPKVSPYALIYSKQEFYLVGIKEGEKNFYNYRVDRIKNLKILNEDITIKKTQYQIKEFAESSIEMFGGEKVEIKAMCDIKLLDEVLDTFGKNITIEKTNNNDKFILKVDTSILGFKMWAMRNIDLVEVKEPVVLKNDLKNIISEAKIKYEK